MRFLDLCDSSIISDLSLLNILCMEGAVYNIKFTYLTIVDVTQDF